MTPPIGKGKKDIELLVMLVSWQCYSLMIWKGIGSVIIYKNKNVLYIHGEYRPYKMKITSYQS